MIIDMMQEAKNRYPVGTIFLSTYEKNGKATVVNLDFRYIPRISNYTDVIENSDGGWVYANGKWAEIVELGQKPEYQPLIFN